MDDSAHRDQRREPHELAGIVVGIDGSMGSVAALHWAAETAGRRGVPLHVVTAWHYPAATAAAHRAAFRDALRTTLHSNAQSTAQQAADEAAATHDVQVTAEAVEGPVGPALVAAAVGADMLVVGNRRRGEFGGLLPGPVSRYCLTHAPCAVVVVPLPGVPAARAAGAAARSGVKAGDRWPGDRLPAG